MENNILVSPLIINFQGSQSMVEKCKGKLCKKIQYNPSNMKKLSSKKA